MAQLHASSAQWRDDPIRLQSLRFALALQLDKQISRGRGNCAWAALVCEEADELCLEARYLRHCARILRLSGRHGVT